MASGVADDEHDEAPIPLTDRRTRPSPERHQRNISGGASNIVFVVHEPDDNPATPGTAHRSAAARASRTNLTDEDAGESPKDDIEMDGLATYVRGERGGDWDHENEVSDHEGVGDKAGIILVYHLPCSSLKHES